MDSSIKMQGASLVYTFLIGSFNIFTTGHKGEKVLTVLLYNERNINK